MQDYFLILLQPIVYRAEIRYPYPETLRLNNHKCATSQGYECLSLCKTDLLFFVVKDQSCNVQGQPTPCSHTALQIRTDCIFFYHLCRGWGTWHLLCERSLVLSLSPNVWVYWCAVTGPGWSSPTRIRASCWASTVCSWALMATNRSQTQAALTPLSSTPTAPTTTLQLNCYGSI